LRTVDVERNAGAPEERFGLNTFRRKVIQSLCTKPFGQRSVRFANAFPETVHFIERSVHPFHLFPLPAIASQSLGQPRDALFCATPLNLDA